MSDMIPLSVPNLSGSEWEYVKETIETGWVSSVGSYVERFEESVKEFTGAGYAVATMNGTAALHASLVTLGVGLNNEVLVPNLTFIATLNAVSYCGAVPVLIDSEWSTLGMSPASLESFLNEYADVTAEGCINKKTGRKIKAMVPMHTLGYPVQIQKIMEIADKYNISLLEDAAESLGSSVGDKHTGRFGAMGCLSFNGNKIITTGGGGMIITDNDEYAKKLKHITTTAKTDGLMYDHDMVGYNYRLVNVLAAIGVAQMELLPQFLEIKERNRALYMELLDGVEEVELVKEPENCSSNHWMYGLKFIGGIGDIRKACAFFEQNGVQVRPMWKLMEDLPMYNNCEKTDLHVSREIYNSILNIPCSTNLKAYEIEKVVETIKKFVTLNK